MKRLGRYIALSTMAVVLSTGLGFAQEHRDDADHHDAYVRHEEWKKGYHMKQEDWSRAQRVDDWKAHHLRQPPRGYEWREVDGNYVLAAVATGVIASAIVASAAH